MINDITVRAVEFRARDGFFLHGDVFYPDNPEVAILISAGTGFPRQFYRHVAEYLASRGGIVMTYDYRGMGGSALDDIANSCIDYHDWGCFDLPAALNKLDAIKPDIPLTHLAHSVGGHFIGLAPNHGSIRRHAFVSVGTGYFGGHHVGHIPTEFYFWWVLGPYCLARHGYIKPIGGWKGEPLPPKLFKTWRRWSHRRAYFKPDLIGGTEPDYYDAVTAPIRSWLFLDDPIATPSTARDLLSVYPSAPCDIIERSASEIGVRWIGHEGAFRKGRERLWSELWDWLSLA